MGADLFALLGDDAMRLVMDAGQGSLVAFSTRDRKGLWVDLRDRVDLPLLDGVHVDTPREPGSNAPARQDILLGETLAVFVRPLRAFFDGRVVAAELIQEWVDPAGELRHVALSGAIESNGTRLDYLVELERDDAIAAGAPALPSVPRYKAVPFSAWLAPHLAAADVGVADQTARQYAVARAPVRLAQAQHCEAIWDLTGGEGVTVVYECPGGLQARPLELRPPRLGDLPGGPAEPPGRESEEAARTQEAIDATAPCLFSALGSLGTAWGGVAAIGAGTLAAPLVIAGLAAALATGWNCGKALDRWTSSHAYGDPHIRTWDGASYELQARGEFVYLGSPNYVVQTRFDGELGRWTGIQATAIKSGRDVIEVYHQRLQARDDPLVAILNGRETAIGQGGTYLAGGTFVTRYGGGHFNDANVLVVGPDGSYAVVENLRASQDLRVTLTSSTASQVTGGLAGLPDGDRENDFVARDGSPILDIETIDGLYGTFAAAWRVMPAERLFSQGRPEEFLTDAYTAVPDTLASLSDYPIDAVLDARERCTNAGLIDPGRLDDCAYDVLVAGEEWADQAGGSVDAGGEAPAVFPADQRGAGDSPVIVAAGRCRLDELDGLLADGSDPNVRRDTDGWTPLLFASQAQCPDGVALLLDRGADPAIADDAGFFPLYIAAQNGRAASAEVLIERGADPLQVLPSGESPLLVAAARGHADVASALLTAGAAVDIARNSDGLTPLLAAAQRGQMELIAMLLAAGADPDRPSWRGQTSLMAAAADARLEAVRQLLAAGADPNLVDVDGRSALHFAADADDAEVVTLLLSRGADATLRDAQGRRAADYAGSATRELLE